MSRKLTRQEIDTLINQRCHCDNWELITVVDDFCPLHVKNIRFSGEISLGLFNKEIIFAGGIKQHTGLYNAALHNCTIGNNVYINNVHNYIANYNIGNDVYINNIDILYVDSHSSFGNNTKVAVLSESGGREVPIFNLLSAQMAYIIALYRHRPKAIANLCGFISKYSLSKTSSKGNIEEYAFISDCQKIKNVNIGAHAQINACYRLQNGTINSCEADPSHIGYGVIAEDFIISTGTRINDGAVIYKCFVGQGCELSKQYSAENSLFFANSAGFHGEACSIFAGPFTVTHHKSTLLIAGMFSFMNAGSGSNQSNHMYKLGPIHQGIMERGAKTASDSYILWPAKIGAFTSVMGRHFKHSDTSDLPFSYLIENNDQSVLVPGANLQSVGTIRDAKKWPKRDKRKDPCKLDFINYNLLSPYTINKVMNGVGILKELQTLSGKTTETYSYQNTIIRNSSLKRGIDLYNIAIIKFLGNSLISRLQNADCKSDEDIQQKLKPSTKIGLGDWTDVGGMLAPKSAINDILNDIESKKIASVEILHDRFKEINDNYYEYEWTWAYDKLNYITSKEIDCINANDVIEMVKKWQENVVALDKKLYDDAHKEFTLDYKVSFGSDGTQQERNTDFAEVRGDFENNTFVIEVLEHIKNKTKLADYMINKMNSIA